jgi:hypothetical protein
VSAAAAPAVMPAAAALFGVGMLRAIGAPPHEARSKMIISVRTIGVYHRGTCWLLPMLTTGRHNAARLTTDAKPIESQGCLAIGCELLWLRI